MPDKVLKTIKPRKYQQEIYENCRDKNCLVVLPTGIGKCMEYSEPLLFSDGSIKKIGDYFEDTVKQGRALKCNKNQISVKPKLIKKVISLNNSFKLEEQKIIAIHKIKADLPLLKIKTYAGAEISVTPEHPLLTLNHNLEWIRADHLKIDSPIATPLKLPEPKNNREINMVQMFSKINSNMNCYVKIKKDFAKRINLNKECKFKELLSKKIDEKELTRNILYFIIKGGKANPTPIKNIEKFSPELLYWTALVIGEGGMYGGIRFYNEDKTLLNLFKQLSYKIFRVKPKKIKGGLKLSSTALYFFVRNLFDLKSGQHSRDKTISDNIMRLDNKCISNFISGLYDAEGSVRKDGLIELMTASKELANRLCYLLSRFEIKPRMHEKISSATNSSNPIKRTYYRINIEGTKDAKIFDKDITFKQEDKKRKLKKFLRKNLRYNPNFNLIPISGEVIRKIRNSLGLSSTKWKDFEIPGIDTYERGERKFSKETLKKAIEGFKKSKAINKRIDDKIKFLERLLNSDIYWDKIKEIKKIKCEWVYDISIKKNFNFIAGANGGVIAHNTLIALMLAINRQKAFPGSKCLFLAPTRPLADQHLAYFKKHLPELFAHMELFTGKIAAEQRKKLWERADIVFSTPQCIGNDLKNNLYDLTEVSLLIEDECHRCLKNYSYTYVANQYKEQSKNPRILGLTASPGTDKQTITKIANNLGIESIELRTRESEDVKEYLQKLEFNAIKLEFPEEFKEIVEIIRRLYEKKVEELKNRKLLFRPANKITLLELQSRIMKSIFSGNRNFNYLSGASACAQAIKLSHLIELIQTQTLHTSVEYIKSIFQQSAQNKSKAAKQIAKNPEFNQAYIKINELLSKNLEHPKLLELKSIVEESIKNNPKTKIIVFSQYRETGIRICKTLNEITDINAKVFVGQAKKTNDKGVVSGLNQKEQHEIIEEFKQGKINIIISTSIGEEGLDIPEVNSVIFYEPIPSAIRKIQRAGRTARLMKGKLTILITKDTLDEIFYYVAIAKEKRMYKAIESIKQDIDNGKPLNPNPEDEKKTEEKQEKLF
jgi:ERCC4-related helicase